MTDHIPDTGKMVGVPENVIDRVLFEQGYDRTEGTSRAILSALAAAGMVVVPAELLRELADDLAGHIAAHYGGSVGYANMDRRRNRDMEPVNRARAMLAAVENEND